MNLNWKLEWYIDFQVCFHFRPLSSNEIVPGNPMYTEIKTEPTSHLSPLLVFLPSYFPLFNKGSQFENHWNLEGVRYRRERRLHSGHGGCQVKPNKEVAMEMLWISTAKAFRQSNPPEYWRVLSCAVSDKNGHSRILPWPQLSYSVVRASAWGLKGYGFNSWARAYTWVWVHSPDPVWACVGDNRSMCLSHRCFWRSLFRSHPPTFYSL